MIALPQLKMCSKPGCCSVATSWDGLCATHAGNRQRRSYNERPESSRTDRQLLGIELELVGSRPYGMSVTPLAQFACSDGSLPDEGAECKLLATEKTAGRALADLCQRAGLSGVTGNKRCGLHVHLGYSHRFEYRRGEFYRRSIGGWTVQSAGARDRLMQAVESIADPIRSAMPASRRVNDFVRWRTDLDSHYNWISLSEKVPTIEVRCHGATVNPWKALGWIEVCLAIRDHLFGAIESDESDRSADGFLSRLAPGSVGHRYYHSRVAAGGRLTSFGFGS